MGLRNVLGDVALTGTAASAGASSGPIANSGMATDIVALIHVTAATGTTPTLAVALEQSDDNSSYTAITGGGTSANLTAAGNAVINARATKPYVRVTSTIGGTTPAITYRVAVLVIPD
jgi:hypothetical protein